MPEDDPRKDPLPTQAEIDAANKAARNKVIAEIGHPRAKEWVDWVSKQFEMAREAGLEEGELSLPPFHMWLRLEEEKGEKERNRPRIKTANPPVGNVYHGNRLFNKIFRPGHARDLLTPWKLFTYSKNFTAILANGKPLQLTVWFSLPESLREHANELEKVTHRELMKDIKRFIKAPADYEIEKFLHHALVQFQKERDIPILNVWVTPDPAARPIDETGVAQGHITHVVSTPIGVITYAYRPSYENLPDAFFEAETDTALVKILKNDPAADLRVHQKFLRINILRIEPKKRTMGFGPPVGDAR